MAGWCRLFPERLLKKFILTVIIVVAVRTLVVMLTYVHIADREVSPRKPLPKDLEPAHHWIKEQSKECTETKRTTDDQIKTRNNYWQTVVEGSQEMLAYSAFYDDRPAVGMVPLIQIQALVTSGDYRKYCQLWYEGFTYPLVVEAELRKTGRIQRFNKISYEQVLLTCPLENAYPIPSHVSLTFDRCKPSSMLLPIEVPMRSKWKHEFGVCVAIAFGEFPWEDFIEWIELTSSLGVAEFHVYNGSMSSSMIPLFDYYEKKGMLYVHQMPPPQYDYSKQGAKISSPASLNDCMLRYMYRYKYIIVLDFDEIIIPRSQETYHDMLQHIDKQEKLDEPWLSYTFHNMYYFKDSGPTSPEPKYSTILRYRARQKKPSGYLYAPKSIIDPRRCLSVFNHYCYIRFKGFVTPFKWTIDVDPAIAMSHHYRKCNHGKKCDEMLKNVEVDDYVLKYNSTIKTRMLKAFKDLRYDPS